MKLNTPLGSRGGFGKVTQKTQANKQFRLQTKIQQKSHAKLSNKSLIIQKH